MNINYHSRPNYSQLGRNTLLLTMFFPLTNSTTKLSFFRLNDFTWISTLVGVKGGSIDRLFSYRINYIFSVSTLIIIPTLKKI